MKSKKRLIQKISYEHGGTLLIFEGNSVKYIPSKRYEELRKRITINTPLEERIKKWEENKLLFEKNIYPQGDVFLDKLLLILQSKSV